MLLQGHILEDRRISPKPALRKGLSGTLLQLLNNSADAVHLQCTVVVIGRLARDKNCRDDMIAQGVLQVGQAPAVSKAQHILLSVCELHA